MGCYCLEDYAAELNIVVPKNATFDDSDCDEEYDIQDDDNTSLNEQNNDEDNEQIISAI